MTKHTRRNHGAVFKAKVALEAIKGEQTLVESSALFRVHPNQIAEWKKQLPDRAPEVFDKERKPDRPDVKELHAKIGRLAMELMRLVDEIHPNHPYLGTRGIESEPRNKGHKAGRSHARTLMGKMGVEAPYRKPRLTKTHPELAIYPYLVRGMTITEANAAWCSDITYIPMAKGFCYLVAIMDRVSRKVLARRLSNTLDTSFCAEARA